MTHLIQNIFGGVFGSNVILACIVVAMIPIIELRGAIPFAMATEIWGEVALSPWLAFAFSLLGSSLIVPVLALIYIPLIKWLKTTKLFRKLANKIDEKIKNKSQEIQKRADILNDGDTAKRTTINDRKNYEGKKINKGLIVSNDASTVVNCQNIDNSSNIGSKVSVSSKQGQNTNTTNKQARKAILNKNKVLLAMFVLLFVSLPLPFTGIYTGTCVAVALGLGFWLSCLTVIVGNAISGIIMTLLSLLFGESVLILFYIFMALILLIAIFWLIRHFFKNKIVKNEQNQN